MSFDKTKAMRSAERYLSQGKIRAAISEYKQIVEQDQKDFSTLNMLGDLHVKNSDKKEAIACFFRVADHYGKQGFSQKAIAIYNKIAKLQPDTPEVSARLAELYQEKGSLAEARSHYISLAEQYQRAGKKIEALAVWKQISQLDPYNADVCLKIAESYWKENQKDESAEAFTEAGNRLTAQSKHEAALAAYSRALEIRQNDFKALNGFVKSQISLGYADEAAKTLENILEKQPYNRDILFLLVDCHLETDNPEEAEKAAIKLVEQEPANYPKFLDLIAAYLKNNDLESASRILSMSSEHLLVGGQSEDFLKWTNEILARDPEHIVALRLLIRYYGWQRDESEVKNTLERLAETSRVQNSIEDERFALAQLVRIVPHEVVFTERLREVNETYGFSDTAYQENLAEEYGESQASSEVPQFDNFEDPEYSASGVTEYQTDFDFSANGNVNEFDFSQNSFDSDVQNNQSVADANVSFAEVSFSSESFDAGENTRNLSFAEEQKLEKEIESIDFYIEQGYHDLALKTLEELEDQFGRQPQILNLRAQISGNVPDEKNIETAPTAFAEPLAAGFDFTPVVEEETVAEVSFSPVEVEENAISASESYTSFDDFKNDLGLEESAPTNDNDYETHFQTATVYKEMGLSEEAIREFQDAINLVSPNDGTRRYFQSAHLLGNCFMEKQMPNLALMWYKRALETKDLTDDEKQGMWYEIGNAYQSGGEPDKALENFEMIYAVNVDYRDVGERIQSLHVNS